MNNNVPFLNWGFMVRAIPEILKALPMTLNIAIVTMIFSLILSFFIALVRINKIPVLTRLATIKRNAPHHLEPEFPSAWAAYPPIFLPADRAD